MPPVRYHAGCFPPDNLDWSVLAPLIGAATAAVARYDGMLAATPSSNILLAPLREREAVMSSRIEGTQATVGDILLFQAGKPADSAERRDDVIEVVNYRKAMQRAEEMLETLPLCQRVVRDAHRVLMLGARGENRAPGEYRRGQNWIGPLNCKMEDAKFIPVPADKLPDAMDAWERHIHAEVDPLVQAAVSHAEFEALHPFMDGNGRMGRILIPLLLWRRNLIHRPMFYISAYFDANRDAYYERLLAVSRDNDWTGWCQFFLEAVRVQAEENLLKTRGVLNLYEEMKRRAPETTRSQYAVRALDWIFRNPIFRSSDFVARTGIPEPTAHRIINALSKGGILKIMFPGGGRRSPIYSFPELLRIAED